MHIALKTFPIVLLTFLFLFDLLIPKNFCYVEGDKIYSSVGTIPLEVNFSTKHMCKILSFKSNEEIKNGKFHYNLDFKPSYMVDSNGKFVRFSYRNSTLYFYSSLKKGEEKYFFPINGTDKNVLVFWIFNRYKILNVTTEK